MSRHKGLEIQASPLPGAPIMTWGELRMASRKKEMVFVEHSKNRDWVSSHGVVPQVSKRGGYQTGKGVIKMPSGARLHDPVSMIESSSGHLITVFPAFPGRKFVDRIWTGSEKTMGDGVNVLPVFGETIILFVEEPFPGNPDMCLFLSNRGSGVRAGFINLEWVMDNSLPYTRMIDPKRLFPQLKLDIRINAPSPKNAEVRKKKARKKGYGGGWRMWHHYLKELNNP